MLTAIRPNLTAHVEARRSAGARRGDDRGFALVIVLALMALLAIVSAILTAAVRTHIRQAKRFESQTHARALSESAVEAVAMDLQRNASKLLVGSGRDAPREPIVCTFGDGGVVAVIMRDVAGRIDLNFAQPELLSTLISGLGVDPATAAGIAKNIEARRTSFALGTLARRSKVDPPPQPFDTEEAIRQIDGVTPQLATAMMPYITVHSGTSGIDPQAADPELVALLGSGTSAKLLTANSARQAFVVTIGARADNGGTYGLETVIRASRDKRFPVGAEIRAWRPAIAVGALLPAARRDATSCLSDGLFTGQ